MSRTLKELKNYCKDLGYDNLRFWPSNCLRDYAVSIRMKGNDMREEFDANVVLIMNVRKDNETKLLDRILEKLQEPVVVTMPLAENGSQQKSLNRLGLRLIPGRWTDNNDKEYEIYVKGKMNMGGYVNLIEHIKEIGCNIDTIKRNSLLIMFSFVSFLFLSLLKKHFRDNVELIPPFRSAL